MAVIRSRLARVLLSLAAILLAFVAGIVIVVLTTDLGPIVARQAGGALGRRVTIGSLAITWANPLGIELRDVHLANPDWASEPDMLHLDHLVGDIDLGSLFRGVLRFERLRVDGLSVLLERDAKGAGNWRFKGGGAHPAPRGGLAVVPANRTQFPTLIDFVLEDATVRYRTSSGQVLRIDFAQARIRSDGDDAPANLTVDGGYNGERVQVKADADSFARMRDPDVPYGARISVASSQGTIDLDATFAEPVDFEGAHGRLRIAAPQLADFLDVFGADAPLPVQAALTGVLDRRGDHWQVTEASGDLGGNRFGGRIQIDEGARGQRDALALDLSFQELNLDRIWKPDPAEPARDWRDIDLVDLRPEEKPGATIDAQIAARRLSRGKAELPDVRLQALIDAGVVELKRLGFAFAGGRVEGKGRLQAAPVGSRIQAEFTAEGSDAAEIMRRLGADGIFQGNLNGRAALDITGATLRDALSTGHGTAVIAMTDGKVASDIVEKAAVDLHMLFRKREGWSDLVCLLGVADLRQGIATLAPLRLRTVRTTVRAGGRIDLLRDRMDLTMKADGAGPSVLALKVPISISGALDDPSIKPLAGSNASWLNAATYDEPLQALPSEQRALALGNACAR